MSALRVQQLRRKSNYLKLLKLITVIVCIIFFILNVLDSFTKFLNNATIQTSFAQTTNVKLPLPAFLVCRKYAFNDGQNVFTEDGYKNATKDPTELQLEVLAPHSCCPEPLDPDKYQTEVLNTVFHGRCVSIKFLNMVSLGIYQHILAYNIFCGRSAT